ncbi:MAG TPA: ABC transporter permease [Nitrolancea sp.]|nr:ABC transporter permease [Nitrolancea sp.]
MSEVTNPQAQSAVSSAEGLAKLSGLRSQKSRSLWSDAWRQYRRHRLAMASTIVLAIIILAAVFGYALWGHSYSAFSFADQYKNPSLAHPMGTDDLGHDQFARVLWGGRVSISVGIVSALVAIIFGTLVGAIAGYFGGFIDSLLMRITDLFISLPTLPLLLLVIYLFQDTMRARFGIVLGTFILIVAIIGALTWMPVSRLVRGSFLSVKEKEFIESARSVGVSTPSIIFKHILPNVLSPVIVAATLGVAQAIITESTLSFLGLGFPPDTPTWGRLLSGAQNFIQISPYMVIFPGAAIFLTVLSINYIGDGLRDALDPRHMN